VGDGPTRPDGSPWLIPAAFLIFAALLALLLVRELDQYAPLPVPDRGSRSIGNAAKSSPPSTGEPEPERKCGKATNNSVVAVGSAATKSKAPSQITTTRRTNPQGGYSFRYAHSWNVRQRAEITRVIGPGRDFVISFGPGPTGGLPIAFDEFAALVRETYRNVRVSGVDVDCVGGYLSAAARGRGTNVRGTDFEFLAKIIKPSSGQAVGAFGVWRAGVPRLHVAVREVIDSFQANPRSA
jgi:hypothetical protein